ncbi:MAG: sialate O-acetylesterase [Clostridium sp.]|nr:sialate O-acetylesterase [Clostridium sp.]
MKKYFLIFAMLVAYVCASAAPDPNFHIYICLGQSNMEGAGNIEPIDRADVPERFKMMAAVDFSAPARQKYSWYVATPPLVRQSTGLCPADWFGRTMVDNLPQDVKVGVICVAVGGCKIEHLDKNYDDAELASQPDWFKAFMAAYGNHPYQVIVDCAKKAQEQGVIKGILLHQGESNNCDQTWPAKVNKVYTDLLSDLGLSANDVPLIVGELVQTSQGGACGAHNPIINSLPQTIPTAHVVSSGNLEQKGDGLHFTSHAYRVLGGRYAAAMLKTMGISDPVIKYTEEEPFVPEPKPEEGDFVFDLKQFNPKIWADGSWDASASTFVAGQYGFGGWEYDKPIDLSGYKYIVAELEKPQSNGAKFRVFDTASYWVCPYSRDFGDATLIVADLDGMMKQVDENDASKGIVPVNTKAIYRVGFWAYGNQPIKIKQVFATNNNPYDGVASISAGDPDREFFNIQGMRLDVADASALPSGIYIVNGKKVHIK